MAKTKTDVNSDGLDHLFVLATGNNSDSEKLAIEPYSYWGSVFRVFLKKNSARLALGILAVLILGAILIPLISPHNTEVHRGGLNPDRPFYPPSWTHWFGTDELGRDLLVTTFSALGFSLRLAMIIAGINAIVGVIIGSIWGFFKKIDKVMIEITNLLTNIPNLLLWIIILFVLTGIRTADGQRIVSDNTAFIITLTSIGWLPMARLVRNQILIISDREYNLASKTLGTSSPKMIINNILPFILPVIITNFTLTIPATVAAETSLSFFGLGLREQAIALGPMLTLGFNTWISFPWVLLAPAAVLGTLTAGFYLLGLALSDSLDPKLHR